GQADLLSLQVLRLLDAVGAHPDRGVAEHARHEGGNADVRTVAERGAQRVARQRQLADVEVLRPEGAEEDLLRRERHEDRIDAVDPHGAVDQGTVAVIVADGDGQIEIAHLRKRSSNLAYMAAQTRSGGPKAAAPYRSSINDARACPCRRTGIHFAGIRASAHPKT